MLDVDVGGRVGAEQVGVADGTGDDGVEEG